MRKLIQFETPLCAISRVKSAIMASTSLYHSEQICTWEIVLYRGTSSIRNRLPVGPYSRAMSRALVVLGGGAVYYERGTRVGPA